MPPSRYRVIERGRRLIVVDTRSGMPVTGLPRAQHDRLDRLAKALRDRPSFAPAPRPASRPASRPAPAPALDGANPDQLLTTQPWFDHKAPRRVVVATESQGVLVAVVLAIFVGLFAGFMMFGWPVFVVIAFLLFQKGIRNAIVTATTQWVDTLDEA